MRYPPQFLDRIRQHFRVSEIISRRMTLKRHGREFQGLCPFHNEKTPSFTVNDEKGFYHCFGCGAHGDVIRFIVENDGMQFGDAIEMLAREAGIDLPKLTAHEKKELSQAEQLYEVMKLANEWFANNLHNPQAARILNYVKQRGIADNTIKEFNIGFAPRENTALKSFLLSKSIPQATIALAGLLSSNDRGESYDKFRHRIMFPINDITGRVIAFGGRIIDENTKAPKYLNSPDTPLFKKSYILYNADKARKAAAKCGEVIVAEGYTDVIALSQAGFYHAVAPLGTAITKEQLSILWQMVDEPTICLDGDNAGERAMLRLVELAIPLLNAGKSLKFCSLPKGEDPDSFIKNHGKLAMGDMLKKAAPLVNVIWQTYYASKNLNTPEKRAGAERELMFAIAKIADEGVKSYYQEEMKNRIWQATKANYTANSKHKKGGQPSDYQAQNIQLVSPIAQSETMLYAEQINQCVQTITSIILFYPSLIHHNIGEEILLNISTSEPYITDILEVIITDIIPIEDKLSRNHFTHLFKTEAIQESIERLMKKAEKDTNIKALTRLNEEEGLEKALEFITIMKGRIDDLSLQQEHKQATIQVSSGDEHSFERFKIVNDATKNPYINKNYFGDENG